MCNRCGSTPYVSRRPADMSGIVGVGQCHARDVDRHEEWSDCWARVATGRFDDGVIQVRQLGVHRARPRTPQVRGSGCCLPSRKRLVPGQGIVGEQNDGLEPGENFRRSPGRIGSPPPAPVAVLIRYPARVGGTTSGYDRVPCATVQGRGCFWMRSRGRAADPLTAFRYFCRQRESATPVSSSPRGQPTGVARPSDRLWPRRLIWARRR